MAISVKDLIAKKEALSNKKKELYDLTTSIGVITVAKPSDTLATEAMELTDLVMNISSLIA